MNGVEPGIPAPVGHQLLRGLGGNLSKVHSLDTSRNASGVLLLVQNPKTTLPVRDGNPSRFADPQAFSPCAQTLHRASADWTKKIRREYGDFSLWRDARVLDTNVPQSTSSSVLESNELCLAVSHS